MKFEGFLGFTRLLIKSSNLNYEVMKNKLTIYLLWLALLTLVGSLSSFGISIDQNQKTVSGRVSDTSGQSLPGVTVVVKATTHGTITNSDGEYSLSDVSEDAVLVFSFVGMRTTEMVVGNQSVINVVLEEDAIGIEEVITVGYGIQKKETLTGSVVNVAGEELAKNPTPNVTATLQGRLPGLVANQRSGEPGRDDPNILIRGNGTFGNNAPLIIIDGVERSLLGRLNPDEIESISVLKDASAAIYGARAANGVIIVTTKQGKIGKPVFSLTLNNGFQQPTIVPEMLDAVEFAQVFNEAEWYRKGRRENTTPFYTDEVIEKFRDGSDPILYPNTNWIDEVLKPYSLQQRVGLQVNGGSEAVRYLLSFSALTQDGQFNNDPTSYDQYNARVKVDVTLSENLTVGANINAILNNKKYSTVDTWINFTNILVANPTLPARYPNGLIAPGRLGENPLLLDQRGYNRTEDAPLYSTFTATYKIPFIEGLRIDASFNYDLSNQFQKFYSLPYYYHEYNVITEEFEKKQGTGASTVELTDTYRKWTTKMFNYRLTYDKTFNNHQIVAMVGQEQQENRHTWARAYRKNFVSTAIDQINVGSTDPEDKDNGGSETASAYNNYFGRLNYNFQQKYLVEFLFRYDGSQIFPEGKRYGFFPGVSMGWRLSEEAFIKDNLSSVDQLKIRFSHGQIGNDRVGQYQYLQSYSFGNNYVFGGNDAAAIYANTMPNPDITWEVSKKTDIGLDASLWNNLLGMELTLWKENRSNILAQRNLSIPAIVGFSALPSENIGEVDNHGFEAVVRHRNKTGKFTYNIDANIAYARSKIVFMDETPQAEPYQSQTGMPVGASLFYKADGIFNTQEELDEYPSANGTKVGDIKIIDMNDDGEINSQDQFRFDKSSTPEYVFGLNMGFQYMNFDMSMFFQGQANAYNYDDTFAGLGGTTFDNAMLARAEDRWTVDNPDGTMPRANAFQPGWTTFFLYDATFIRLKTFELGYSLPQSLVSRIAFDEIRFYVSAFNLLTWAKEIKWSDPEISGNSLYYPQQRVINLGLNVKF
jgi:TonB-linked SusC/RagA family outer membrane protein